MAFDSPKPKAWCEWSPRQFEASLTFEVKSTSPKMRLILAFITGITILAACNTPQAIPEKYLLHGDSLSNLVQQKLSSALMQKMQEEGPAEAIAFCNLEALSLTRSAAAQGITIQRIAARNRNPLNALGDADSAVWRQLQTAIQDAAETAPVVVENDSGYTFYKPIMLAANCLPCHGEASEMPALLVAKIDSLYPADKAKGFAVNDLRGMWKIHFPR